MKCKHNWQAVRLERERAYFHTDDPIKSTVCFEDWLVDFVCPKCNKLKTEVCKYE